MYFQTSFHVGSTTGYRGNGKLIIEMKPASLSYHGGQLCASLHPPPSTVLECVLFYIYSHFLLINPYKCTQEKDVLRKGKVKNGAFIESKISQEQSPSNSERNRCSCISSHFMAFRPFHSKSTNPSIFQVRCGLVTMLAVKMHQPLGESESRHQKRASRAASVVF